MRLARLAGGLLLTAAAWAQEARYLDIKGSAWRLAAADLDGDGRNELVYGAYEGAVRAIEPAGGRLLWEAPLDGFPFAIAAGDVDGKRGEEVFAATAGGSVYALSPRGGTLWRHRSDRAVYNVAVGRGADGAAFIACGGLERQVQVLSPAGKLLARHAVEQLVHRLATADLDGDGASEIVAIDRRTVAEALAFDGRSLRRLWRKDLTVPGEFRNWENPRGSFYPFSLVTADLDGDRKPEFVMGDTFFNKQAVMAAGPDAASIWLSPILPQSMANWREEYSADTWYEFYSTAWVRVAEIDEASPGPEVVSVTGGNLRVFSAAGRLLRAAEAPVGFADFVIDGLTLYLGSSPNGDNTIYRVPLEGDYVAAFRGLGRNGLPRAIGESLDTLRQQVLAYRPTGPPPERKYGILMFRAGTSEQGMKRAGEQMRWFRSEFPYPGLQPFTMIKVIEPAPPLDENGKPWNPRRWETDSINGTMTVEEIVEVARRVERNGLPAMFNIGHSCMPFVTLDTVRRMIEAAPRSIVGFESAEDEDFRLFPRFAKHYFGPLADLCAAHGIPHCATKNKGVWWMSMPSVPEVFDALFTGGRSKVLDAVTEDSNSRTPEINLMARMGLRQAGLIGGMQASAIGDLFSFCRFHQWEYPKHGHPYLRLFVAHTLMGADSFEYRVSGIIEQDGKPGLTRMARESAEIFFHMLGKGIVFPPRPDQMAGLARAGIAVHPPPEKWLEDAHNGHRPEIWKYDPELESAVLPRNGSLWGITPTPEHALTRVLFRKRRQFGYQVPPTPYGPVAIVPAKADLGRVPGVDEWWHTDGIHVWRDGGPRLTGARAAKALEEAFEKAAARLPFRAYGDDVFFHSVRLDGGRYRLYAIDPGWLDPQDRRIEIRAQLAGRYALADLLTGERLPAGGRTVKVTVPAGSLRILEAFPAE